MIMQGERASEFREEVQGVMPDTGGAMVLIPAWQEYFYGPVTEVRLPDGEKLKIVLSHPIPDGHGLLITPKGADGIEVRLAQPEDIGQGQMQVVVPSENGEHSYRWAIPGTETRQ